MCVWHVPYVLFSFFAKAFAVLLRRVSEKAGEHYQNLCPEAVYLESPAFFSRQIASDTQLPPDEVDWYCQI